MVMRFLCYHILYIIILLFGCKAEYGYAQAKTEQVHITFLLASMQSQNSSVHSRLYPEFDTMFMHIEKHNPQTEVMNLRSDLTKLQKFDPAYNNELLRDFDFVIKKGTDSGLHWRDIILAGYELHKTPLTKNLIGLDKIMELRFHGFVFVEDMLTRRRYCIAVKDVECMKGKWYGGHLINILEAKTIDEYHAKLVIERKKALHPELFAVVKDTSAITMNVEERDEDEDEKPRKEVVERLYYTGMFDNEIPVELYIRGLKGDCPERSCYWEAMYKFQDHDEFTKLIVERMPDGKWLFTEDPDVGSMELDLNDGKFTGVWISLKDKTEYEVTFSEKKEVRSRKLLQMDDVIENELYAQ